MPTEILMPALSPTMEEGRLAKWHVCEGDTVAAGDILAEIETDKATMEFEAVEDGILGPILIPEGSPSVPVNTAIALLLADGEDTPAPKPSETGPQGPGERIFASPLARRLAAERGIDLATLTGSGPRGRIVMSDLDTTASAAVQTAPTRQQAPRPAAATGTDALAQIYADRPHRLVPLDGMRSTVAARLTEAKQTIPHFYLRRSIRLDALLSLRVELNAELSARGVKLSVNDFIIKAAALALQRVPAANAIWGGDHIVQFEPSDVAVAVAVDGGLYTPVLRDAHLKPLTTLSIEMKNLADRARARKLAPQEYQGGSFAISNLGMYGIENFDAVINPPHGAILAVGAGLRQPVATEDDQIALATLMSVTLSADHRVIDGAVGAQFLTALTGYLEKPLTMLV